MKKKIKKSKTKKVEFCLNFGGPPSKKVKKVKTTNSELKYREGKMKRTLL